MLVRRSRVIVAIALLCAVLSASGCVAPASHSATGMRKLRALPVGPGIETTSAVEATGTATASGAWLGKTAKMERVAIYVPPVRSTTSAASDAAEEPEPDPRETRQQADLIIIRLVWTCLECGTKVGYGPEEGAPTRCPNCGYPGY